jgi:hypothetical protein
MKVLLDQNTAKKLRFALRSHLVMAAEQMGWARIANGSLIRIAEEAGFDVLVTADQNIYYQQNNKIRKIALVVLSSNHWPDVKLNFEAIADAFNRSSAGTFIEVEIVKAER